jgi:hypothetical protein
MDDRDQIDELLDRATGMRPGPTQVALTEEAVNLADHHNDVEAGFQARLEHVSATLFAGLPDRMLVAFSWMLAQFDRDPHAFDAHRLLWQYKWVVNALPDFPQITRTQIEEMFTDMERRYRKFGASMQTIFFKKRGVAYKMGDAERAAEANRAMIGQPRDDLSDCLACEVDSQVEYHFIQRDYEQGVLKAAPILNGRYSCSEVPQVTYAQILIPLLRLDRGDEAMGHHLVGYKMIARNPVEFIPQLAENMEFLTLSENLPRAVRLFEKHLILALESPCPEWRFRFFLAAKLLCERLAESGRDSVKLRMPDAFPIRTESGKYQTSELADWFAGDLTALAQRFDARNGNDHFARRIASVGELKSLVQSIPVPKRDDDVPRYSR